jgi:hypothetical protein
MFGLLGVKGIYCRVHIAKTIVTVFFKYRYRGIKISIPPQLYFFGYSVIMERLSEIILAVAPCPPPSVHHCLTWIVDQSRTKKKI